MARLPIPGSDSGSWGDILNDYLSQTHNPDGTLRSDVVSSANISDGSIDATKLAESYVQSSEKGNPNGVATLDGTGKVPTSQLPPGTDPVMGGDLTGTASNAQIAGGSIVDADINASAAIAQSKIANLTADLAGKAAASHAHAIADVTNLQTSLDAKADEAITVSGGTSLTGGGDLTASRTLTLVNDSAVPGNSRYYGTDGVGAKGFHTLPTQDPALGGDLTGTASNAQIGAGAIVDADINASAAIAQSKVANLTSDLASKQTADADLTAIATLSPANDDLLQRKAGAWTNRTPAQIKTDLALTKSDVGLANVDNTSDASKPISTATQTALDAKADETVTVSGSTSLTGGGDLTANRTLTLVNDSAAPGNGRYYGTDGAGTKGYHAIPAGDPAMGGDLSGTASNAQIVAGAVGNTEIANDSIVASSKLADSSIVGSKVADTTIGGSKLLDGAITTSKLFDGAVTNVKVSATAAIAQSKIANLTTDLAAKADETITVSGGTSLTGGGDLTANRTLTLVNDAATPGNSRYYGTDGAGAKGFHTLPAQDPTMGGDLSGTASNAQIVAGTVGIAELAAAVAQSLVPTGSVTPFAGSGTPSGWLVCDGTAVSRATYATLFTAIGIAYGAGDGSTTFNLPNLKGKVPVGLDAAQTEFDALGESGGSKTHTLTVAEMPSHTHVQDAHNHTQNAHNHTQDAHNHTQNAHSHTAGTLASTHTVRSEQQFITDSYNDYLAAGGFNAISGWNNDASNAVTGSTANATATNIATTATNQAATATNQAATATNQNTGGGGAHNNLQPYITLNYIIKH